MNTANSAEHWLKNSLEYEHYKTHAVQVPVIIGISQWDMPDGRRLRREMRRSTKLRTEREVRRWAKRHADVSVEAVEGAVAYLKGGLL